MMYGVEHTPSVEIYQLVQVGTEGKILITVFVLYLSCYISVLRCEIFQKLEEL